MELKNEGLEDDFPFQTGEFQVPAVNFPKGMRKESASHTKIPEKWPANGSRGAASMPGISSPGDSSAGLLGTARVFSLYVAATFFGEGHHAKVAEDGPFREFWIHSDWDMI